MTRACGAKLIDAVVNHWKLTMLPAAAVEITEGFALFMMIELARTNLYH